MNSTMVFSSKPITNSHIIFTYPVFRSLPKNDQRERGGLCSIKAWYILEMTYISHLQWMTGGAVCTTSSCKSPTVCIFYIAIVGYLTTLCFFALWELWNWMHLICPLCPPLLLLFLTFYSKQTVNMFNYITAFISEFLSQLISKNLPIGSLMPQNKINLFKGPVPLPQSLKKNLRHKAIFKELP